MFDELSIVDWFNQLRYFVFLKDLYLILEDVKSFVNLYSSQHFCLFCSIPCYFFFKNNVSIDFQWSLNSRRLLYFRFQMLLYFQHWVYFEQWMCPPNITRTRKFKTRWSTEILREILSSVSPVQVCYK